MAMMISPSLTNRKRQTTHSSIRLLRHATLIIELGSLRLLVDPMLCVKERMDPVANANNKRRIPMVDLPVSDLGSLLEGIDAVLITHTHRDHWDEEAANLLGKDITIFCQPEDKEKISMQGFNKVLPVQKSLSWRGLNIHKTGGQHGTGEIGKAMGPVSGFVLQNENCCIYIAGDTIWCDQVAQAIKEHRPHVVVLNAGGAQFLTGDPITMTATDVEHVCAASPDSKIIAVHMDAVNHCLLTRKELRAFIKEHRLNQVYVPQDGEALEW